MKERMVETNAKNVYAKAMDTGVLERSSQQQEAAKKEKVATTTEREKEAKNGIKEFLKAKLKEENTPQKQEAKKQQVQKAVQEGKKPAPKPLQAYVEPSSQPKETVLAQALEVFRYEAEGKALQELETAFLTKKYLQLRDQAAQYEVHDTRFLSGIQNELNRRGVLIEPLIRQSFRDLAQAEKAKEFLEKRNAKPLTEQELELVAIGGMPLSGGADGVPIGPLEVNMPSLRDEVEVVNGLLSTMSAADADGQLQTLRTALERVIRLHATDPATQAEFNRQKGLIQTRISDRITQAQSQQQAEQEQRRQAQEEARKQDIIDRRQNRREGIYGEHKLDEEEKEYLRLVSLDKGVSWEETEEKVDEIFNNMFRRVDNSPHLDYREAFGGAGNNELSEFKKTMQLRRDEYVRQRDEGVLPEENPFPLSAEELKKRIDKLDEWILDYSKEEDIRRILHSVNYVVLKGIGTAKVSEFAQQFESEFYEPTVGKKGVVQAMHFFEQAMLQVMAENNGYLPNEAMLGRAKKNDEPELDDRGQPKRDEQGNIITKIAVRGRVEYLALKNLQEAQENGIITQNGVPVKMKDWEMQRALALARGMGIVTARTIEIAATSKLPMGAGAHLVSLYAQDIIKDIAVTRHSFGKYYIGRSEKLPVLLYRLKSGGGWDPKELQEIRKELEGQKDQLKELNSDAVVEVVNGLIEGDERFLAQLNALGIGGLFTRTGWRYDRNEVAQATARLLTKDNPYNERLGVGMWIEKEAGNLGSKGKLKDFDGNDVAELVVFGKTVHTQGERAHVILDHMLDRAAAIQPLKILNNFPKIRDSIINQFGIEKGGKKEMGTELSDDLRVLALVQEKTLLKEKEDNVIQTQLVFEDLDINDEQKARIQRIQSVIHEEFAQPHNGQPPMKEQFIDDLHHRRWKLAFNFGTDDLPYDEYEFVHTGSTSVSRRWRDIAASATAAKGMSDLVTHMESFHDQGSIIKALRPIYDGISGYDEGLAKKVTSQIAEGVIKFYKKGWVDRLPFGIGTLTGLASGESSYAQIVYGRGSMAWDELEVNEFQHHLHENAFLPHDDHHFMEEFQKRIGNENWNLGLAVARTAIPLLILALTYYLLTKVLKEK